MEAVIQLTQGKSTQVSQEDFAFLSQWKWHAQNSGGCCYAVRSRRVRGKREHVRIHKVVAARMGIDMVHLIDHIDGDGLNNTRSNLRAATIAQNGYNRGKQRNNTSGYKGVCWDKSRSKWKSQIVCDGTHQNLGHFDTKEDAAEAYRKAAENLHKEFARA